MRFSFCQHIAHVHVVRIHTCTLRREPCGPNCLFFLHFIASFSFLYPRERGGATQCANGHSTTPRSSAAARHEWRPHLISLALEKIATERARGGQRRKRTLLFRLSSSLAIPLAPALLSKSVSGVSQIRQRSWKHFQDQFSQWIHF